MPLTDGSLLFVAAGALLGLAGAGAWWVHRQWVRPARFLRDVLQALTLENPGHPSPLLPALAPLNRAAGPLAGCAAPLLALAARLREMDRQLHDESVNLQAILGGLSEGVLIVDRSHKIRLANDGLRRMFDLRASPLNRTLLEVFRHHDVQQAILEALDGDPARTRPLALATRQEDGRYVEKHFDLTAAGLLPRGVERPVGAIAIFHDVSRLKALEAVRREFVANVSHELRTPLSIINGYLETLLEENAAALADREHTERFLHVMWKHGQRLNALVEDLLTLSQLESGGNGGAVNGDTNRAGLHFEPMELRPCLERVIERLAPIAAERGITVRLEAPEALTVEADAHQLDQAVFNLLENALKYGAPAGGGGGVGPAEVRLRAELLPEDGEGAPRRVAIAVSDDGPGVPLADQPHVFERFYRVHKDRSREAGGTGLGLSIVKHIAQAHGGGVALESTPGSGATFRLHLPLSQGG